MIIIQATSFKRPKFKLFNSAINCIYQAINCMLPQPAKIQFFKVSIDCFICATNFFFDLAKTFEHFNGENRLHHSSNRLHPGKMWKIWIIVIPIHCNCSWIFTKPLHQILEILWDLFKPKYIRFYNYLFHSQFQTIHSSVQNTNFLEIFCCIIFIYHREVSSIFKHLRSIILWVIFIEREC